MRQAIKVGAPDWRSLENAIPTEYCESFMFMGKVGDIVLYKHRLTRRYLNAALSEHRCGDWEILPLCQ
jgi:hypothetical protein